ncbi:MAG: hypothetical protein IIA02_11230 [Proteobacteria bacterium]|uniref:outer membrane lipoprotein LolB n=1 Tax=Aquabacterium sp. TaxID=1872578 RepID=UPI0035C778CF|nr:hypothetical protein [Pseudomonadota bacterium]
MALIIACAGLLGGCASLRHGDAPPPPTTASTATSPPTLPQLPQTPQTPPPAAADLAWQGQLSIKLQAFGELPAKGVSFGFFFSGRPDAGQLELMTPLGSQLAHIGWNSAGAWVRRTGSAGGNAEPGFGPDLSGRPAPANDDGTERFDGIDALSERLLGEALPLETLMHWLQGRPDPARPSTPGPRGDGSFAQDGWQVDTRELPRRLQASRPASERLRGVQIKVHLDP